MDVKVNLSMLRGLNRGEFLLLSGDASAVRNVRALAASEGAGLYTVRRASNDDTHFIVMRK